MEDHTILMEDPAILTEVFRDLPDTGMVDMDMDMALVSVRLSPAFMDMDLLSPTTDMVVSAMKHGALRVFPDTMVMASARGPLKLSPA